MMFDGKTGPMPGRSENFLSTDGVRIMGHTKPLDISCCGETPAPPMSIDDRPGYRLLSFVDGFLKTDAGPVPRIKVRLGRDDLVSTFFVRCGIRRHRYTVVPGLYAVGEPDSESEVLVTANFKLTFDHLRKELGGLNVWILVLDTRGVNVWCAAGKGTFATDELVNRIEKTGLSRVVGHRRLIVPQLGATGVSAHDVKKRCGFRVVYGPVRSADIRRYLENGRKADTVMREVTFSFYERMILTPVEVQIVLKPALVTMLVLFILSGVGPDLFSLSGAWTRGGTAIAALGMGILSGAVATPVFLPFIPGREFALKGIFTGCIAALVMLIPGHAATASFSTGLAVFLFIVATSSFLAMNFTGATPFTAPSGVEKEMKRFIPVQLAALVVSAGCWVWSAFPG